MIVRNATNASFTVLFPSGAPDGAVQYAISDPMGELTTGSFTPPEGAVSVQLGTGSEWNTLGAGELHSFRDLTWSYEVDGAIINGEIRYTVEARLPIGVSNDGVRRKLGVEITDLPDEDISLVKAYLSLQKTTQLSDLPNTFSVIDAVEAQAALDLLPTMAVRVAAAEESGTDKYKRQDIDWGLIALNLSGLIDAAVTELNPTYDPTALFGALLILAGPTTDAFTGA